MNGIPFSQAEENYIWACHKDFTCEVVAQKMSFIFGTKRSKRSVYDKLRVLLKNQKKTTDHQQISYVYIPKGKPVIKTGDLVQTMTNTNASLYGIAEVTKLDIDTVRALVNKGGIPEPYDKAVRAFFEERGEVV